MAASCKLVAPASFVVVLLIILATPAAVHSVDPAAVPVAGASAAAGNVEQLCAKSNHAETCTKALSSYPESNTASDRGLAELCLHHASKAAAEADAFIQGKVKTMKAPPVPCIQVCVDEVSAAKARLAGLSKEMTEAVFADMKKFFDGVISIPNTCALCPSKVILTPDETAISERTFHLWDDLDMTGNVVLTVSPMPSDHEDDEDDADAPSQA